MEKVLQNGEEYFSSAVSLDGVMNYGYFMPVYQNDSTEIIGMVFVGANKEDKDAVVNGMIFGIGAAVCDDPVCGRGTEAGHFHQPEYQEEYRYHGEGRRGGSDCLGR